jgi:hypothetical protein
MQQHREIKLFVVIALGLFAGFAAAIARHHFRPRPVRRARPRSEDELDVPLIILPDDGRRAVEKDVELDISFPAGEGAEEGSRGEEARN